MIEYCDVPLRVIYADTDQMGVAYYANYFIWFEVGRTEFCRQRGFSYDEMERESKSYLVVAEARCRYKSPLRYDKQFVIRTRLKDFRKRIVVFSYQLLDPVEPKVYAEGETVHVITDPEGHPKSFPEQYKKFLIHEQ
jgi:acyl-CoA thioester hydrolase